MNTRKAGQPTPVEGAYELPNRQRVGELQVAAELYEFLCDELLPLTDVDPAQFWRGLEATISDLSPVNEALLEERDRLQLLIDDWLRDRVTAPRPEQVEEFLREIGYALPEPDPFRISTSGVDAEVSSMAGPQLVVPVLNARFALNAVNARWGSLYDAFYGTDALGSLPEGVEYDPVRGAKVVSKVRSLLDEFTPLTTFSHAEVVAYAVVDGQLKATSLRGEVSELRDPSGFRGFDGDPNAPTSILLRHHGLHFELRIDRGGRIGANDAAGIDDVLAESALTTIVDFEDSVAAVDASDKVAAYRNWLGLNCGTLEERFEKDGKTVVRSLAGDRRFVDPNGDELVVPGRAVMLVRNVGLHMRTDAVLDASGTEVFEGIVDAFVTVLAGLAGMKGGAHQNSRAGSVYVVKPKMHGPEEVAFAARIFERVEDALDLPRATVKIGVMDEERRTSVNLAACVYAVRDRIMFINTGFLDRSGDEIHTAMEAGALVRKPDMKSQSWLQAYEDQNVDIGLAAGFSGHAQIGKGMWAMPDLMADMLDQKVAHTESGASTAWVPSPTAATLHSLHYHRVNVEARQKELSGRRPRPRSELLRLPVANADDWPAEERIAELEDNAQSILGYVVRWVDQGIGCSKVLDTRNVALMEDRATLRISSQLMANWVRHGVVTETEVVDAMLKMARIVDRQNIGDPAYRPMSDEPESNPAFQASLELVLDGARQPNGYCEPILHRWRRKVKAAQRTL